MILRTNRHEKYYLFAALGYPDMDRRWMSTPHIKQLIMCSCGGDFDLAISVLP